MNNQFQLENQVISKRIVFLVLILLCLGIFLRFANLDRQPYWSDEVHTSVLISGYTFDEQRMQLQNGEIVTIEDLHRFQAPDPDRNLWQSAKDTVINLASEDNRHTPLYYVLTTIWVKLFGHSVTITRCLSALLGVLVLPCLYWLCQEVFGMPVVSSIAVAIAAVSPVHVLYAQEARPYSLLTVTILLSSAALLQALRVRTKVSWVVYAVSLVLGIYTHILFSLVAIGHGIYVLVIEKFRFNNVLRSYLIASLGSLLLFSPWVLVMLSITPKFDAQTEWQLSRQSFLAASSRWTGIVSRAFFDFNLGSNESMRDVLPLLPLILVLIALIGYSIYFVCRRTPMRIWLFIITLIGVTGLALVLPDLIFGQRRGTTRFIFPCILGMQMSIAYLLSAQMLRVHKKAFVEKFWQVITLALLSVGIISCVGIFQSDIWWNKGYSENKDNAEISRLINQAKQPLIVSDAIVKRVQTLSYELRPEVRFQLVDRSAIPDIPVGFSDVFLFEPSESLRSGVQEKYNVQPVQSASSLWRVEN